ncbi:MAG: hypothetical protein WD651_05980 [Acidimicrobiia bacterium]
MTVTEWLLDSDPSIRWQVMRDLTDEPNDAVAAERSRIATEGWGARLLALQDPEGQWGRPQLPAWTDERSAEAIDLVESKRDPDGRWPLDNTHPGRVHFDMEEGDGKPSRWNTLRAMRVLAWYGRRR